jgi:adenosylcobinamide kinase/adenosylcobinamide-phosphate guanylyltransferase
MGKITFILGGARSGKSANAVDLAKKYNRVAFIATCLPLDDEMKKRVELHKQSRLSAWHTIEESYDLASQIIMMDNSYDCIIIDCLTLYLSNLIFKNYDDKTIESNLGLAIKAIKNIDSRVIIVSNEVGLGIVPENALARRFRDLAGRANQKVAQEADEVLFMVSGLPLKLKGVSHG